MTYKNNLLNFYMNSEIQHLERSKYGKQKRGILQFQ